MILAEVRFTAPFQRRFKDLSKRYRKIQEDIRPIIETLEAGEIIGRQIAGTDFTRGTERSWLRTLLCTNQSQTPKSQTIKRF